MQLNTDIYWPGELIVLDYFFLGDWGRGTDGRCAEGSVTQAQCGVCRVRISSGGSHGSLGGLGCLFAQLLYLAVQVRSHEGCRSLIVAVFLLVALRLKLFERIEFVNEVLWVGQRDSEYLTPSVRYGGLSMSPSIMNITVVSGSSISGYLSVIMCARIAMCLATIFRYFSRLLKGIDLPLI